MSQVFDVFFYYILVSLVYEVETVFQVLILVDNLQYDPRFVVRLFLSSTLPPRYYVIGYIVVQIELLRVL